MGLGRTVAAAMLGPVSFLDELRGFLWQPDVRYPAEVPAGNIVEYRRHFLETLETQERKGADEGWLRHQQATLGRRLDTFAELLSRELFFEGIPPWDIPDLVGMGISMVLGAENASISRTRALVLREAADRALKQAIDSSDVELTLVRDRWRNIAAYAREIQAVQVCSGIFVVTAIGHALRELSGLEAVKWTLHVEAALSIGPNDPWRVDRRTLHLLASNPRCIMASSEWKQEYGQRPSWSTLRRLAALGVVEIMVTQDGPTKMEGYEVYEPILPILDEIGRGEESPMSVLVGAMLEDDLQHRLPAGNPSAAAEATVRQARLVVHEVRNALIPVKVALGSIYQAATRAGIEDAITTYRQRVDAGLERVLSFATELGEVARLTGETQEIFDVGAAVREAAAAVQDEGGPAPMLSLPEQLPLLRGVRSRFVLALVNLLRNACQAVPAESGRVAVRVEHADDRLRITVDDNGPGVSLAERARIFLDGYSTRSGGSGQGLALAKVTIEGDMGGTLTCEDDSSLGGARFAITLVSYRGSAA